MEWVFRIKNQKKKPFRMRKYRVIFFFLVALQVRSSWIRQFRTSIQCQVFVQNGTKGDLTVKEEGGGDGAVRAGLGGTRAAAEGGRGPPAAGRGASQHRLRALNNLVITSQDRSQKPELRLRD